MHVKLQYNTTLEYIRFRFFYLPLNESNRNRAIDNIYLRFNEVSLTTGENRQE